MADKVEKKIEMKDVLEAVSALRESAEKNTVDSAAFKEMEEKTAKIIDLQEKQSQAAVSKQAEIEKKQIDLDERVQEFELRMAKQDVGTKSYKDTVEYKALNGYIQTGDQRADEFKTLRLDVGTAGGVLTTNEMDMELIKDITEVSPIRQHARVKTVGKRTLDMATRSGIPTATFEGETESGSESESTYGSEQLTAHRQTYTVPVTLDILQDSIFDLMSLIQEDANEAFASGEGRNFIKGTGNKTPEGIFTHEGLIADALQSGGAAIDGDDLIKLQGELKDGYNNKFYLNRASLTAIRLLKDTVDGYLWLPGINGAVPNTLAGDPYVICQDIESVANGALPIGYGDLRKGYTITDRTGLTIIRDEFTQAKKNIILITFHRYLTGGVTKEEAIKLLQMSA